MVLPAEPPPPQPPRRKPAARQGFGRVVVFFGRRLILWGRRVRGRQETSGPVQHRLMSKFEYFKIFREYRLAEQHLLNHRITWNLAVQGFLFATYGFCVQKLVEIPNLNVNPDDQRVRHEAIVQMTHLMTIIPWVGFLLSLCVWFAVIGAMFALKNLRQEWDHKIEKNLPHEIYLPNPAGGGASKAIPLGYLPPFFIPLVFAIAWLYIILWHRR